MMKKTLIFILLIGMVVATSGCASYLSYQSSKQEVISKKIYSSNDEAAIKAFRSGNAVGIGIDITALDVLGENPLRQLGAAILDVGILYGLYLGIEELEDNDDSSRATTDSGIDINTTGDNNNYTITTYGGDEAEEVEETEE